MKRKDDTSWDKVAGWYEALLGGRGTYQKEVILPNLLRLLEIKKGEKILDIACGQGFFSREIAKSGGEVTGVDLAPELIKFAKEKAGEKENYFVASADNFYGKVTSTGGGFDKAVCVLAIQNIENLVGTIQEASWILKKGGKLFLVLNHPAFRNPKHTAWDWDEKNKVQYRRVEEYLSESKKEIDMTPGTKEEVGKKMTVSFHRPLQTYFKALVKNGFLVGRLEEWNSNRVSEPGPRQKAEDKARKEIPLFLLIEAVKLG